MKTANDRLSIKAWAEEDRPREKLLSFGRKEVSNAEIIALLLGSGSRSCSALELAKNVLSSVDHDINQVAKMTVSELTCFKGIGPAKAANLIAAFELSMRIQSKPSTHPKSISCSMDAYKAIKSKIADLGHEEFWILILNNSLKIMHIEKISTGGVASVLVDARIVFQKAIAKLASSIILCHNHPSGKLYPSHADKELTKKLVEAGKHLDIKISDHIIVTQESYYSFNDEGIL